MTKPTRCRACTSTDRAKLEADIRAGALSFKALGELYSLDKMVVYRHSRHMDPKPEADGDTKRFEWSQSIEAAQQALVRSSKKHDIRAMGAAVDLLQSLLRLQQGTGAALQEPGQEGLAAGIGRLSDAGLVQRRRHLMEVVTAERRTDAELRTEIEGIELILKDREAANLADSDDDTMELA